MAYRANPAGGRDEQGERPLYEKYARDPVPDQRQQEKLIAVTWRGQPALLYETNITLRGGEKEGFIERYKSDLGFVAEAWKTVTYITPAFERKTPEEIIKSIQEYPLARQVFTLINFASLSPHLSTDEGLRQAFNRRDDPRVSVIARCITSTPDVVTFTKQVAGAIFQIEHINGHAKAEEYLTSYRVAAGLLYGKQLEYMDQLLFLEHEVKQSGATGSQGRGSSSAGASEGSAYEQSARYQPPPPPREEKAKPADVGGFSTGGEVKKRRTGENSYEDNDTGVGGVVSYIRSMHQVPIVIEGRTDYRVYQIPGTAEYLAKLKGDTAFAQGQVKAVAKAMKERVLEPDPENGSKRSPTSKFHLRMQGLFHPDSMNRYSDNSTPIEREKYIRAELFKAYQEIVAKNPSAEFYGLA